MGSSNVALSLEIAINLGIRVESQAGEPSTLNSTSHHLPCEMFRRCNNTKHFLESKITLTEILSFLVVIVFGNCEKENFF